MHTSESTTPPRDNRGKHNKISEDSIEFVKAHIESIPAYESHYTRRQKKHGRKYLVSEFSIQLLYDLYVEKCSEENKTPVSVHAYRKIFCSSFNIGFKPPSLDTCNTCDGKRTQIECCVDENEKRKLQTELDMHLFKADSVAWLLANYKEESIENPAEYQVIALDLQQALPTPKLSTNIAFYKRKLWTFNLSIHDVGTIQGQMFIWPEHVEKEGPMKLHPAC